MIIIANIWGARAPVILYASDFISLWPKLEITHQYLLSTRTLVLQTLLFFFDMCISCFHLIFFISFWHVLACRTTCILHMFTMFLPSVLHVFALRLPHVFYLFRSIVRQLYSTKNSIALNSNKLDLRQYLVIGIVRVTAVWLAETSRRS